MGGGGWICENIATGLNITIGNLKTNEHNEFKVPRTKIRKIDWHSMKKNRNFLWKRPFLLCFTLLFTSARAVK